MKLKDLVILFFLSYFYNILHLHNVIQLSSWIPCELYCLHVIARCGRWNTLRLDHSSQGTREALKNLELQTHLLRFVENTQDCLVQVELKLEWNSLQCQRWCFLYSYSRWLVTRLHSICEIGQNDIEIKEILNRKIQKTLKYWHYLETTFNMR